jgi:hypothetical protein
MASSRPRGWECKRSVKAVDGSLGCEDPNSSGSRRWGGENSPRRAACGINADEMDGLFGLNRARRLGGESRCVDGQMDVERRSVK